MTSPVGISPNTFSEPIAEKKDGLDKTALIGRLCRQLTEKELEIKRLRVLVQEERDKVAHYVNIMHEVIKSEHDLNTKLDVAIWWSKVPISGSAIVAMVAGIFVLMARLRA